MTRTCQEGEHLAVEIASPLAGQIGHVIDRADSLRAVTIRAEPLHELLALRNINRVGLDIDERVRGLKAGGDDYLTKPFAFAELLARVEVLARRDTSAVPVTKLQVDDLELDLLSRQVKCAGKKLNLQPREFRLLEYLMRHTGRMVTRTMLSEGVWDYHFDPQTNVIDMHVSRLRQKVDKAFPTALIHTMRNAGYMLRAKVLEQSRTVAGFPVMPLEPVEECRARRGLRLNRFDLSSDILGVLLSLIDFFR